jgi:hypothetical protein
LSGAAALGVEFELPVKGLDDRRLASGFLPIRNVGLALHPQSATPGTQVSGCVRYLRRVPIRYRFPSLEDFLTASELTVDGALDDGWGAQFAVKGRELEATILFADISDFSGRTATMTPTETLAYVNNSSHGSRPRRSETPTQSWTSTSATR